MADNKPTILGGTAIKPKERHGWEAVRYLIHNPETGEYFTRTPKSWLLITTFYIIYYSCLAAFWAAMLAIFLQTLPDYNAIQAQPKWTTDSSIIGMSPGLGMRPKNQDEKIDSAMIQYNIAAKEDTDIVAGWGPWAERAQKFLKTIEQNRQDQAEGVQQFDLSQLGDCGKANTNLGYDEGKPCIFLKLNRIYGLENTPFEGEPTDEEQKAKWNSMPESLKQHIEQQTDKKQVWVECHGQYPADVESLGQPKYYPASQGFAKIYFPYKNQKGYESPLVAVQFPDAKRNQLLHVECRAWAQNIGYDKRDRIGINLFELHLLTEEAAGKLQ